MWVECKSSFSPFFVKTTCFRQGTKPPFPKTTVFSNPDYFQKTRDGCGCLWDAFRRSRGKLRESPGKIAGKIVPESRDAMNSTISGTRKANLPGTLGRHCPGACPHLLCKVFLKSTVTAFSSFSDILVLCSSRGQKLNTNFFLKLFWDRQDIRAKFPDISPKEFDVPVSRDIPNFLAPTPSRGRPPPHQKISGLKSLVLGSFFVPEKAFCCDYI